MRIALVTETYPPEVNGVALTLQALAERLPELGHEIHLVRPRQGKAQAGAGTCETLVRGLPLPRYPGLRFGLASVAAMERLWRGSTPGAVYVATEGPLGWVALKAARRLGIPVATGFHTRFDDFVGHYGLGALAPLVLGYLRRFHNAADATLVPTRTLRTQLINRGFRRVNLLARGVDAREFSPARRDPELRRSLGLEPDDLLLLYFGRISPEKNLELCLRAYRSIRARVPRVRMMWVGDGPALPQWRRAHPEILFAGQCIGWDLTRHVASADLFLFPSLTETFGNVTLESLAAGVPVVAFDYGAAEAYVINGVNGRTAPVGDADAFVAAAQGLAEELAHEPQSRARYRNACRASVATLSHEDVAREFAIQLANLAQRRKEAA